jgi:hypothetical protein
MSPSGISGLGKITEYGASLVPLPPARITVFKMISVVDPD